MEKSKDAVASSMVGATCPDWLFWGPHLSVYTSLVCSVRSCTHCSCVVLHSLAEVSSLQLASSLPESKRVCQLCSSSG